MMEKKQYAKPLQATAVMSNKLTQLRSLLGSNTSKTVATVAAVNANNTLNVTLNSGAQMTVLGSGYSAGSKVYVEDGKAVAQAADLAFVEIDI
mgnify:CR=1 FL=1